MSPQSPSSSLFSAKRIVLPVVLALLLTPYPKRFGLYRFLLSFDVSLVGLMPCQIPTEKDWGYTLGDFYGDGASNNDDEASKKTYRNRLWGQTAIVTGANSGTGYEISLALARMGVGVTMACRNPQRCEAAAETIRRDPIVLRRGREDRGLDDHDASASVHTMTVDTSSLKSVREFCHRYRESRTTTDEEGRTTPLPLDMLYLNAGIGLDNPTEEGSLRLSVDGIENMFATNVVGHHLMYKLLEPHIRQPSKARTSPPRIVLTSSAASYHTIFPYRIATDLETLNGVKPLNPHSYPQSKLAQILWARELTARVDAEDGNNNNNNNTIDPNSVVYANAAHPGLVATNIWLRMQDLPVIGSLAYAFFDAIAGLMWTPEEGALTLVYLGTAVEELRRKKTRGQYFHPQSQLMENHRYARDDDPETKNLQENLWKFLDELVADFL